MARVSAPALLLVLAASLSAACGSEPPASFPKAPLEVTANPPGFTFEGSATIELTSSRPAQIYYTLQGDHPIGPSALLYEAPIRLESSTLVTFIAASDDGIWSEPATELYIPAPDDLDRPALVPRALQLDRNNHFFSPSPGQVDRIETTIVARSVGLDRVQISNIYIGINPKGWGFFEDGVFRLEGNALEPLVLGSGESLNIVVSYAPTVTVRSALLVVESDDQRSDGYQMVELWGRAISW